MKEFIAFQFLKLGISGTQKLAGFQLKNLIGALEQLIGALAENECKMLLETLKGNRGVFAITKKDEYQAKELTFFSCEKNLNLVSYEDEKESS